VIPRKYLRFILPVLAGVIFIGLWYAVRAGLGEERRFLLPTPDEIIRAFAVNGDQLWSATLNTTKGAVIGFSVAVLTSFFFALVLSLNPLIRASLYPYLMILQMTPIIVLAPILILWAGAGIVSVTIITFLICFFPMTVNTTQGLISTDANLVDFFRMCKASKRQEIFLLRVPAAAPYFFTGLRIAATLAPIGAIVGDFYAGNSAGGQGGLGFLTIIFASQFKMAALFATAVASCALGFLFAGVGIGFGWLAMHKWHDSYARSDA
jgi:NitT/TauT family transport system permease protein